MMFALRADLTLVVLSGAVLYGLLRWRVLHAAAPCLGRGDRLGGAARQPFPRDAARHQDDQAVQRAGGPPRALAEPAGRDHQPAARRRRSSSCCFRTANSLLLGALGILVVWLGARRVLDNLFSVGMLLAFIAYKDQFLEPRQRAHRPAGRPARCCGCMPSGWPTSR